jgi:SAM-dependent methyltransferase
MSKYIKKFGEDYQKRVGHYPTHSFLTDNSIELANFLNDNDVLKNGINVFEIGSGGCRNLKYINDLNDTINLFANDLHSEASFENMHESIKDKVKFIEMDTLSLIRDFKSVVTDDIDIFISSDHLMHIDKESVVEIIDKVKTIVKPKYILLRELFSEDGEDLKRLWPRVYHEYNLEDTYSLIKVGECSKDPHWYSLKLYKRI